MGGIVISTLSAGALLLVVICSLASAALVPGGVIGRSLGTAVVARSGGEIGRGRSLLRAVIALLPGLIWLGYLASAPRVQRFVPTPESPVATTLLALAVLAAGAVWTVAQPTRGPHDRLLGTRVVPR
jgi:hypothetical protein